VSPLPVLVTGEFDLLRGLDAFCLLAIVTFSQNRPLDSNLSKNVLGESFINRLLSQNLESFANNQSIFNLFTTTQRQHI
jgi:hypothetical protein